MGVENKQNTKKSGVIASHMTFSYCTFLSASDLIGSTNLNCHLGLSQI